MNFYLTKEPADEKVLVAQNIMRNRNRYRTLLHSVGGAKNMKDFETVIETSLAAGAKLVDSDDNELDWDMLRKYIDHQQYHSNNRWANHSPIFAGKSRLQMDNMGYNFMVPVAS